MMKKLLVLPLLLLLVVSLQAEMKLKVYDLQGKEREFALSKIGRITFNDDMLRLYDVDGTLLGTTSIDKVNKIVISGVTDFGELKGANGKVFVYPNPTKDGIVVSGLEGEQTVRVYDLRGKMMSATVTTGVANEPVFIDVTGLHNGTYLLQIGADVVKFIKE